MSPRIPPCPWHSAPRSVGGIALFILMIAHLSLLTAQAPARTDAVARLRRILLTPGPDPASRDALLKQCVSDLAGVGDVRRALMLSEWQDPGIGGADAQVDAVNRRFLVELFLRQLHEVLKNGDAVSANLVMDLVCETAAELRKQGEGVGMLRPLGIDLAGLTRRGGPGVRARAARVLGQIAAEPTVALTAFADLLRDRDPVLRQAAVDGLEEMLAAADVEASPASHLRGMQDSIDLPRTAVAVFSTLGPAHSDPNSRIRQAASALVGKAAVLTGRLLDDPPSPEQLRSAEGKPAMQSFRARRDELRPLLAALREQGILLVQVLARGDKEERRSAQKALEELARVRNRWNRQSAALGTADDALFDVIQAALPALAAATADTDARVRRSAIEVLETVGPSAAPAAPALAAALDDSDHFVRWSAVRALRNIGPAAARCATPGLARLLEDADIDVRLAAASALLQFAPTSPLAGVRTVAFTPGQISPFARTVLPPLIRSLRSDDTQVKTAVLRTLSKLGPEALPAVPALRETLNDTTPAIRLAAVDALGAIGPGARTAAEDLGRATRDADPEVRRAAGEALLNILRGP